MTSRYNRWFQIHFLVCIVGVCALFTLCCGSDAQRDTNGAAGSGGMASEGISLTLSETTLTFATPDIKKTLTATVSGASNAAVTWVSSDAHIVTVDASGNVVSVSGGEATITATSVADPSKSAQAKVTVAEPERPRAASYVDAKSIQSGKVNIFMCGDSITRTYVASPNDQTGWGQVLNQFLSEDVYVDNSIANGGRSSRSFYNELGRWDAIKARLASAKAAGTPSFVFIMFGHNDQKKLGDTDGANYLTFASKNPNGTLAGTYYDYLERYIVEARELGGIPIIITPFVREYLAGSPPQVTPEGQHNITTAYSGETSARGDYPAAAKAIAQKHDVPLIDITSWSAALVSAKAAQGTLDYLYISSDQTHIRQLGALLIAQEVMRQLGEQSILTSYARTPAARLMLDAGSLSFGGLYSGSTLDKAFRVTPFGDVTGTLTISAPAGYSVSSDGTTFADSLTIDCDANYAGSVIKARFSPSEATAYNADLLVQHSTLTPDYGNTAPNARPGVISLTGNGKEALVGTPAMVKWPLVAGAAIALEATSEGALAGTTATLSGLVKKNVAYAAARFETNGGSWPAEGTRNETRYVEFALPVSSGTFTIDTISVDAGTGGGSNIRWDVAYSLNDDFSSATPLGTGLSGTKDMLVTSSFQSLGVSVNAGQTLRVRVYPYSTSAAASGKSLMLANAVVLGVTN